jgi:hypothetical protein
VNRAALAAKLVDRVKHLDEVQSIVPRLYSVSVLIRDHIFATVREPPGQVQDARVLVIEDARKNLRELPTVELGRFPVSLDEPALKRHELVH